MQDRNYRNFGGVTVTLVLYGYRILTNVKNLPNGRILCKLIKNVEVTISACYEVCCAAQSQLYGYFAVRGVHEQNKLRLETVKINAALPLEAACPAIKDLRTKF